MPTPLVITDAPTIIIAVPESDALNVIQLRIANLEKDVSELKNIDISAEAFAALKTHVPTIIDNYLGTKVGDVFQKELPKHNGSYSEILSNARSRIKKEQAKTQQMPQVTIKSTDKEALKEFDLKSALYQHMHAKKSFNRNPANHRLYHALMEVLIEDENAMDKGIADTGKQTKSRRTKESESSRKPSSTKETPKGKTSSKGSKTGKSASTKETVEEPTIEVIMDDTGDDVARVLAVSSLSTTSNMITDKLDWNNPEGDRYLFNLSKPLPLQGTGGHRTVPADYFFNNDLEYLKTSDPAVTYTTSITKTKAARYDIKGIEDMGPTVWSIIKHGSDKDALKGIKHWGERCKLLYRSQVNKFSEDNVYSTKAILGVKSVKVVKLHGYGHLEDIVVKRYDQQLYTFKEGDFVDLHLNDIEDMLLLAVQHKLFHLDGSDITFPGIEFKEPCTPSYDPSGIVYEDQNKQKRVLRADELYKFSDGTLKSVRDEIHHGVLDFCLDYNMEVPMRKWITVDQRRLGLMIELIDKQILRTASTAAKPGQEDFLEFYLITCSIPDGSSIRPIESYP
ncbi:hypothetical protein Tco_0186307 [Tanacetum coccineum]